MYTYLFPSEAIHQSILLISVIVQVLKPTQQFLLDTFNSKLYYSLKWEITIQYSIKHWQHMETIDKSVESIFNLPKVYFP